MELLGLVKDFHPAATSRVLSCGGGAEPFRAVNGVTLAVDRGQLICLLGHNGAGKTTTINMLTGMLPVSGGDAVIYGKYVTSDMDDIRSFMGICPQHDVLWDQLTGIEHVRLFAGLKGVPRDQIVAYLDKALAQEVETDNLARVVINERTGTIVMGGERETCTMLI